MEEDGKESDTKHLFKMLEYETQLFMEIVETDALVVAAKGISLDRVLMNVFRVYADPGNLVLVLNCSEFEEKYFLEKLNCGHVYSTTYSTGTNEREDIYLCGGVHFVTTRILVVDMLKKRVPIDKITGFIVLKAHAVLESCQEAFVLRLFRQQNKTGFIKGFSNSAQSFTVGFGHVERVMRALFVKELFIWPRFHSGIIQSMKKHEPEVIELHIPVSETVAKIQTSILDLMNHTIRELKRINKNLEMQEVTVENCLTKKFHKVLQNQMDCVWHQLSSKSRQLINELKTLRHLLLLLFYNDVVTFYSTLCTYKTKEYAQTAHWVLLQEAELLFSQAITLVYSGDAKEFNPDFCPKWDVLNEILKIEIPNEIEKNKITNCKVLILCQDSKTCFQLNQFLKNGPQHYLFVMALMKSVKVSSINKTFSNVNRKQLEESFSQRERGKTPSEAEESTTNSTVDEFDELECLKDSYSLKLSQTILEKSSAGNEEILNESQVAFEAISEVDAENTDPVVQIQTFKQGDNFLSLQKVLEDLNPSFIIMYHSNITAIRQIEVFEARRDKERPLKVFFLIHRGTVEEQSYLTALRKEKEAFEFLIETKSTMVIPEDQDGKSDECLALQRELKTPEKNTRQAGSSKQQNMRNFVIVDMREFRSDLPALIHKRGIDIEPLTISVGDYILTNEICVERKSLSDLVGSLNSGRLYQQCTQMFRCYTKPMLLIEFDQNKPFSWQSNYILSSDGNSFDIQQKLLLLTMHFPKLKLIWSPSPYASAQLFEELKEDKEQPNIQYASAIGAELDLDAVETKYNSAIYDFVQKLPGINSKNIDGFLRAGKNFNNILKMSKEELGEIIGNKADTQSMYSILHEEQVTVNEESSKKKGKFSKFKHNYRGGKGSK